MKICMIVQEGYPYTTGGVSSWLHSLIQTYENLEFVILAIQADRDKPREFAYELPENVTEVDVAYLNDKDFSRRQGHRRRMSRKQFLALRSLILNQDVDWDTIFDIFAKDRISVNDALMGPDFFYASQDCYNLLYNQLPFTDFLWTLRSAYLPMFQMLKAPVPKADVYHCCCTGYAGLLGCVARHSYGGRVLISEHGIYTREREAEIIRAKRVQGVYKDIWIQQFHQMSNLAYERSDIVTSLCQRAKELQMELGCPGEKLRLIPNGVRVENYMNLPGRMEEDAGRINIGAVLRIFPIQDVKTLLRAFQYARWEDERLRLWVMGPNEDEKYAQECLDLVEQNQIPDVVFTGQVDVHDYLGRMDMTILTSISEGQPLTILESFAAGKPVIATDAGNCRGLISGEGGDELGDAGIVTHIMDAQALSQAMLLLARNESLRLKMGEAGRQRVLAKYQFDQMAERYRQIYRQFAAELEIPWSEEKFVLPRKEEKQHGFPWHRRKAP